MIQGLVGQKLGMTRVFNSEGAAVPVTVIEIEPNRITQIKTKDNDGYSAIQITTGTKKMKRVNKAKAGHFAKAKVEAGRGLWEFPVEDIGELEIGAAITLDKIFAEGQSVDVIATSKGKGFAGVIKRYNFKTQDATHGNSLSHRAPGSIGQCQTPGRVFKGKKMAGQLGDKRITVQNQEIIKLDNERNLLLVKGGVPGAPGANVIIKHSVKAREQGKTEGDK